MHPTNTSTHTSRAKAGKHRTALPAVLLLVMCALCAWGASTASAAQTRKLVNTFGGASSTVPSTAPLSDPQGVAVDQSTGDVYVADTADNRVEKFDAGGDFLLAFGDDVNTNVVAADRDVCVAPTETCQAGTSASTPGAFEHAQFVAVDQATGDVYVADTADNLVSKFTPKGELVATWGNNGENTSHEHVLPNGQLNGSETGFKSLATIDGIAVGTTGVLYVLSSLPGEVCFGVAGSCRVAEFDPTGGFTSELAGEHHGGPAGVAVDAAGNIFEAGEAAQTHITRFDPAGEATLNPVDAEPVAAFTIDQSTGDLYAAGAEGTLAHYEFNASGEVLEPGGGFCSGGCGATDSVQVGFTASGIDVSSTTGDVYITNPTTGEVEVYAEVTVPDVKAEAATSVGPTSATLHGTVNPDAIQLTDCHFEYGTTTSYGKNAPCIPAGASISASSNPEAVSAEISGLETGTTYHYRLVAGNSGGSNGSGDETLSTQPQPSVDSATASELGVSSARLNASIDPHGYDTTYRFEYGTSTSYGTKVPIPNADIGAGETDVTVSQLIAIEPNTTYHWRVVAESANGTATTSSDHTFIYPITSAGLDAAGLPDDRAYEMVTPPQKNGALIGDVLFGVPDIAGSGERVIAEAIQCFAEAQSCNTQRGDGIGVPYEFQRTSTGWQTTAMAPPSTQQTPIYTPWYENAEEGTVLFSAPTEPFGEDDFYGRNADGTLTHIGPDTAPEDGAHGPSGGNTSGDEQAVSADLSHVVWAVHTSEGHWPFDETTSPYATYEYAGTNNSQPLLVGVTGGEGSHDLISECGTTLGGVGGPPGMMSTDGRTVYFTALTPNNGSTPCPSGSGVNAGVPVPSYALYARIDGELLDAHTVQISARSSSDCSGVCATSPVSVAGFRGASADGSKAFFTSTQQLTNDASEDSHPGDTAFEEEGCEVEVAVNGCNLYLYDFDNPAGQQLIDVSAGDTSGEGPRVQGVVAISEDGSHVYFVAKGVLAGTPNGQGQSAQNGANNLYLYERDAAYPDGRTAFVADLPGSDAQEWGVAGRPANVTPEGRYLVFVSHGDLTPDDTSQGGAEQVFRYDAQTDELVRISIGNDGFDDNGNRSSTTPCGLIGCSEDASIVFGAVSRRDPTMSDNGSYIFFQSPVGLTPQALDDVRIATDNSGNPVYADNVYEWHEGHVYLISDGRDVSIDAGQDPHCPGLTVGLPSAVCLLGTDRPGRNVFFSTADQLVGADTNTEVDYYDARVCEPESPCVPAPAAPLPRCSGEACHGTPAGTPVVPVAPSATFNGQGNVLPAVVKKNAAVKKKTLTRSQQLAKALKACRKGQGKRAGCERQARKRYVVNTNVKGKKKHAGGKGHG